MMYCGKNEKDKSVIESFQDGNGSWREDFKILFSIIIIKMGTILWLESPFFFFFFLFFFFVVFFVFFLGLLFFFCVFGGGGELVVCA